MCASGVHLFFFKVFVGVPALLRLFVIRQRRAKACIAFVADALSTLPFLCCSLELRAMVRHEAS